jgi:1,4-alpha-glucan branching enzyme
VLSYVRRDETDHLVVVLNLTPIPRQNYRVGAPAAGRYVEVFNSDDEDFGGSEISTRELVETEPRAFHGFPQSMVLDLPPLGAVILAAVSES